MHMVTEHHLDLQPSAVLLHLFANSFVVGLSDHMTTFTVTIVSRLFRAAFIIDQARVTKGRVSQTCSCSVQRLIYK